MPSRPATATRSTAYRPAFVAAPASTEEAAAVLRTAAAEGLARRRPRRAAPSWTGALPPEPAATWSWTPAGWTGIVEHAAGDLVVVAQAGVPLAALRRALAGARQQLALDGVVPGATVGGTLGTALPGRGGCCTARRATC